MLITSKSNSYGKAWTTISLRITEDLIEEINYTISERVGISRNAWILEAIQEKLKRNDDDR